MSTHPLYTRKRFGLDNRVWLSLLVLACFSIGLLGFKMVTYVPCTDIDIVVEGYNSGKAHSYYLGERITFSAAMGGSKDIVWDFGDRSKTASGRTVSHSFGSEGSYLVTATINGKCTEYVSISIRELTAEPVVVGTALNDNPISGPEAPMAGAPVSFTSATGASSYEWMVLNSPDFPVQHGPVATFIFPTAGTRIIELKLDGQPSKVYRKTLQVLPSSQSAPLPSGEVSAPLTAPMPMPGRNVPKEDAGQDPATPKVTIIPDEEFKSMLDGVTGGKKDAQSFTPFLCNGGQTKVLVNGDEWMIFSELYEQIKGKKKMEIRSVETVRDEQHCVTLMKVRMKKKGLLGL